MAVRSTSKTKSTSTSTPKTTARAGAKTGPTAKDAAEAAPDLAPAGNAPDAADTKVTPADPANPVVKTRDMLARVAARADLRPNQARDVYEAVLEELGAALLRGEKLRLPPLGTIKVNRQKSLPDADVIICKIRRNKAMTAAKDALAPEHE
ncbi:HU family DNA-binding protein [Aliiroseovarius sp. S2029]|uniref:HU family DNA-binding protein n=1 Tax=Aliiroseovarius sp. S2029 TaxID=2936988 RepID=UPI0020BF5F2D|nr:HU family DNA-binding protein [Aliiroseovarius sp. S2029]MCK8482412.1 HU family DNA-binding protein [Aliiroseovarius sp. S2029]